MIVKSMDDLEEVLLKALESDEYMAGDKIKVSQETYDSIQDMFKPQITAPLDELRFNGRGIDKITTEDGTFQFEVDPNLT